jgi:uncharacterized protein YecE (DUF72 family)
VGTVYWIGTSGYNYPEWKGSFYPADLSTGRMLPYYAARFSTVEINYTFYRMPALGTLEGWARATPDSFRLTLKAPRRITHDARLRGCEDLVAAFCDRAATLGGRLGALLFQLPPSFKKDLSTFEPFLDLLTPDVRAAVEFRHASWHDEEVYERLRAHGVALCVADSEKMSTPLVTTAGHAYFRLRDEGYEEADLARWAETLRGLEGKCADIFVYFKHEEEGRGPQLAERLVELLQR